MNYSKDELRRAMRLYAVTDRMWLKPGQTLAEVCQKVLDGGATFLQLREKDLDEAAFEREAVLLRDICAARKVPFVVNDSIEIAVRSGADGVHLGQSDIRGRDVRALIGPERILGISAGTVEEALAAQTAGADYIGVGAMFPTGTKKDVRDVTAQRLRDICDAVSIPVVAIGGINGSNMMQLAGTGVDGVAVVSAIFGADDPGAAAAELLARSEEMVARHG